MENSAFISYRRSSSSYIARSVFQSLSKDFGIDVFLDVETLPTGFWDEALMNQIASRPYFLLLLADDTLDRCNQPNDVLLREIQQAFKTKRIIIPLFVPNYDFADAGKFLPEPLNKELPRIQGLSIPHDFFEAAMEKLCKEYLRPVDLQTVQISEAEKEFAQRKIRAASTLPTIDTKLATSREAELMLQEQERRLLEEIDTLERIQVNAAKRILEASEKAIEGGWFNAALAFGHIMLNLGTLWDSTTAFNNARDHLLFRWMTRSGSHLHYYLYARGLDFDTLIARQPRDIERTIPIIRSYLAAAAEYIDHD